MTPYVNQVVANVNTSVTSSTLTITNPVYKGSCLHVSAVWTGATSVYSSINDTNSNVYNLLSLNGNGTVSMAVFNCVNKTAVPGNTLGISLNFLSSTTVGIEAKEVANTIGESNGPLSGGNDHVGISVNPGTGTNAIIASINPGGPIMLLATCVNISGAYGTLQVGNNVPTTSLNDGAYFNSAGWNILSEYNYNAIASGISSLTIAYTDSVNGGSSTYFCSATSYGYIGQPLMADSCL